MNEKASKGNTFQTTLRLPKELYEKIQQIAERSERKPSEQIRYMLKEYIEFKEKP